MSAVDRLTLAAVRDAVAATPAAVVVTVTTAAATVTQKRWEKSFVFACRRKLLERGMLIGGSVAGSGYVESPMAPTCDEVALLSIG